MVTCAVGQNRRIHDLAAGAAFPCIKSTNEIIVLLGVHAAFTLGTPHLITSSLEQKVANFYQLRGITRDVPIAF